MSHKFHINPLLIQALEHYAQTKYDPARPTAVVLADSNGRQHLWSVERACAVAVEVLGNEELAYLKLKVLKEGMEKFGAAGLYEKILGEPFNN